MFGVNLPELIVIFVVALIVFGPERLPEIASQLGKLMGELRKGSDSLRREFYNSVYKPSEDVRRELNLVARKVDDLKHEFTSGIVDGFPPAALTHEMNSDPNCPDYKAKQQAQRDAGSGNDEVQTSTEHDGSTKKE